MKGYIRYQCNKAYLKNAMICTGDKLYVSKVFGHVLTTLNVKQHVITNKVHHGKVSHRSCTSPKRKVITILQIS